VAHLPQRPRGHGHGRIFVAHPSRCPNQTHAGRDAAFTRQRGRRRCDFYRRPMNFWRGCQMARLNDCLALQPLNRPKPGFHVVANAQRAERLDLERFKKFCSRQTGLGWPDDAPAFGSAAATGARRRFGLGINHCPRQDFGQPMQKQCHGHRSSKPRGISIRAFQSRLKFYLFCSRSLGAALAPATRGARTVCLSGCKEIKEDTPSPLALVRKPPWHGFFKAISLTQGFSPVKTAPDNTSQLTVADTMSKPLKRLGVFSPHRHRAEARC